MLRRKSLACGLWKEKDPVPENYLPARTVLEIFPYQKNPFVGSARSQELETDSRSV